AHHGRERGRAEIAADQRYPADHRRAETDPQQGGEQHDVGGRGGVREDREAGGHHRDHDRPDIARGEAVAQEAAKHASADAEQQHRAQRPGALGRRMPEVFQMDHRVRDQHRHRGAECDRGDQDLPEHARAQNFARCPLRAFVLRGRIARRCDAVAPLADGGRIVAQEYPREHGSEQTGRRDEQPRGVPIAGSDDAVQYWWREETADARCRHHQRQHQRALAFEPQRDAGLRRQIAGEADADRIDDAEYEEEQHRIVDEQAQHQRAGGNDQCAQCN
ncbi:conserved hypothetical protein, partial [Ricinus communis]